MSAPETASDAIEDIVSPEGAVELLDETVDRAKEIARLRFFQGAGVGLLVGAGVGGALGFIFTRRALETKYNELAAEEIAEMREHFNQKMVAAEAEAGKGDLDEIVRERGYVPEVEETAPPMAVTPPTAVTDRAQEIAESEDEVAGEPPDEPVAEAPEPVTRNVFRDRDEPPEDEWDWHKERANRSPLRPYVIHREERDEADAYDAVTFTFYEADDVVCNERDEVIPEEDRERIFGGEANLEKFGHGSGDPTTVYVRNDQLEMDIELIRSPNSFAEEVHGLEPEIKHSHRRRGRASPDDE